MFSKAILVKCITLLYKEAILKNNDNPVAKDLVRTVLDILPITKNIIGNINDSTDQVLVELKSIIMEMLKNTDYEKSELLQRISLITALDDKTYKAIENGFITPDNESSLKRSITSLSKNLTNYYREEQMAKVLSKYANVFKFNRDTIKDIDLFLDKMNNELEPLKPVSSYKDPAIIDEVDIGDTGEIAKKIKEIETAISEGTIFKTGWQGLNRALQGGFRSGKVYQINAMEHNYKTSFSLNLFRQIALYNKPVLIDSNKKPLLLRISLEDPLPDNIIQLYNFIKDNDIENGKKNASELTNTEAAQYVKSKLQVNGFHIKFLRIDPTLWSYKNLFDLVLKYEAQGYEVKVLMVDYLSKLPTTGCIQGPHGVDLRDLLRRILNFCSSRGICFITPHQLSPDAKVLLRTGIPSEEFVKAIAGKGYLSGSKQLGQETDGMINLHIVKSGKESYLSIYVEKHRLPITLVSDEDKYLLYKFPKIPDIAIKDDLNGEDTSYRSPGVPYGTEDIFVF